FVDAATDNAKEAKASEREGREGRKPESTRRTRRPQNRNERKGREGRKVEQTRRRRKPRSIGNTKPAFEECFGFAISAAFAFNRRLYLGGLCVLGVQPVVLPWRSLRPWRSNVSLDAL